MDTDPSRAATCEDYNSDNSETVPDTRKQANVSAKRSHPSDLGKPSIIRTGGRDAASDSGYSSHTAATLGSADLPLPPPPPSSVKHPQNSMETNSASSATGDGTSATGKTKSDSGSSTAKRRSANVTRPTMRSDGRSQSKSSSSGAASTNIPTSPMGSSRPSRSESQTRRTRQQSWPEEECHDPSCTCQHDRRRAPSSPGSRPNLGTLPSYAAMPRPHPSPSPSSFYPPPSPRTQRYPAGFAPMVVETSQPNRRPGPMPRARPLSYHAGMTPEALWASGMGFGAHADPRGPPPSLSAYANPPQPPHMMYHQMSMSPTHLPYQSLHHGHDRPPMPDQTRGVPPHLPSLNYSTRRPTSTYAPPQIHYEPPTPGFPPSHMNLNPNPSIRQPSARHSGQMFSLPSMAQPASTFEDSSSTSSSESSGDDYEGDDRRRMPPPPGPARKKRPEMRHAATVAHPERVTAREIKLHPSTRTYYDDHVRSNPASGSTSRRPSLVHNRTKSKTYTEPGATTVVESSTSRRRMSYKAHEQRSNDVDAVRKASEAYQADVRARASSSRRRRETEATSSTRDGGRSVNRRSIVIDGNDADITIPLTEEALRGTKRSSRLETLSVATSETGSGRSKAGSSHNGDNGNKTSSARMVIDGRTLSGGTTSSKMPGTSGEDPGDGSTSPVTESIYMQYKGLNVEIQGNMEGKTLSWRQQEDGKPQLVLGDIGENERPRQHSGTQEQDAVQDRKSHRERVKEPSHRTQSRSRPTVKGYDDYGDDERERRTRRRRSSNRTESHSRPTNTNIGDRGVPTIISNSTKSPSATRRGSLHRGQTYHNDHDGTREYHSPLRAKSTRYPSTRSSQPRAVPVVHNRQGDGRLPSRSRSPPRSRSRYRNQSGRSMMSATSKMSKLTMKRNQQYVRSAENSSDDEDTARENQAPSSSSSLATAYLYSGHEGVTGGGAAAAAANTLKSNQNGQRLPTVVNSRGDVSSKGANRGSTSAVDASRGSTGRNTGFVGRVKSKFEEHKTKQLRGGPVRGRLGTGGLQTVNRSSRDSAVFDEDDGDDDDGTDGEGNEGNRRMCDAVQDWI